MWEYERFSSKTSCILHKVPAGTYRVPPDRSSDTMMLFGGRGQKYRCTSLFSWITGTAYSSLHPCYSMSLSFDVGISRLHPCRSSSVSFDVLIDRYPYLAYYRCGILRVTYLSLGVSSCASQRAAQRSLHAQIPRSMARFPLNPETKKTASNQCYHRTRDPYALGVGPLFRMKSTTLHMAQKECK